MLQPHEHHHRQADVAFSSQLQCLHKYLGALENPKELLHQLFKKQARKSLATFRGVCVIHSRSKWQRVPFQIDVWAVLLFLRSTLLGKF